MIDTLYIGSGDVRALMSGKHTKAFRSLMQRFVSGVKPHYNALASPIDALRTGAILERRYLQTLPFCYAPQEVVISDEMDVFKCSLDFAKIEGGKIIDFDELKTVHITEFIDKISVIRDDNDALVDFIRNKHKQYYYQVQEQLYCTGLPRCNIVFLSVYSYDDDENWERDIEEYELCKIRIIRDEEAISEIKERGRIFQEIKDFYKK